MEFGFNRANPVVVFPVVLIGWIFSLCLHEFSHAIVAYRGGDHSVREKGYLSFNPLRYIDPQMSILMPLLFLLLGGIGLPGGAVLINQGRLKSPVWQSLVSLAGPSANIAMALLLSIILRAVPALQSNSLGAGLAFLTVLQISAVLFNLLPVPGFDGFGIIAPWLPPTVRAQAQTYGGVAVMVLFMAMWFVPVFSSVFWGLIFTITNMLGVDSSLASVGFRAFQFWR